MELLKKIRSMAYYLYYYNTVRQLRQFCKSFIDNNLTTVSFSCLYCEKAVKNFHDRVIESNPNLENSLLTVYDKEMDNYDDIKKKINLYRAISRRTYNMIFANTNHKDIYSNIQKHGSMDELVSYCHKSMCAVFDEMEDIMHSIFNDD
jgi:hypothetical protein